MRYPSIPYCTQTAQITERCSRGIPISRGLVNFGLYCGVLDIDCYATRARLPCCSIDDDDGGGGGDDDDDDDDDDDGGAISAERLMDSVPLPRHSFGYRQAQASGASVHPGQVSAVWLSVSVKLKYNLGVCVEQRGSVVRASDFWLYVRWLDPNSTTMRILAVWILILAWQMVELNTFFLKHIFYLQPSHMLNLVRLLLICLISAPTIRQYYVYVTDTRCKRVGTQLWVFCAIMLTESIICIKFGLQMFRQTVVSYILIWLCVQHLGEYADSPIRSLKYNSGPDRTPSLSPYLTATRGRDSLPRSAHESLSDRGDEEDVLIIHSPDMNINHSKHHGKSQRKGNAEKSEGKEQNESEVNTIPQTKGLSTSSSSRRRRKQQANDGDGDGADRTQSVGGGRAGNRNNQRTRADDTSRDSDDDEEPDISAQVESLMSGQLLANGYHKVASPDKKRSPNKQGHHNPSSKPATRSKVSGR
ncbi:phosphatidylserine synthase 1 [Elysia marginata]|uniref:Phosphatidylserine synthase n=1 Tax=Elysia marginata TaxID=1093978 RepID=A0AAV4FUP6_9GAST|nr:phosphatidylserine synthase 1 [Elysia marginata]